MNAKLSMFKAIFLNNKNYFTIFAIIFIVIKGLLLGSYPLMDDTESRYAEIAREMVVIDDWITPRIDPNTPFWGKPPLSFWLTALSYKIFGVSEFSARLPSYILSLATLLLVANLAFVFFGKNVATKAILVLSTSLLFYGHSGFVSTDNAFGFSVTFALYSFIFLFESPKSSSQKKWLILFAVSLALSVLSKGLLGIAFICAPIFLASLVNKKIRSAIGLKEAFAVFVIFSIIAVPWHLIAEIKTPGFLKYYIIGEHFSRFLEKGWQGDLYGKAHKQPFGIIWLYFIISIFPWGIPVFFKILRARSENIKIFLKKTSLCSVELLMYFWMIVPVIFFTFAGNILITYVYPSLVPFSILASKAIFNFDQKTQLNSIKLNYLAFIVPSIFISLVIFVLPVLGDGRSQKSLIETYKSQSFILGTNLIYLDKKPYSADFYLGSNVAVMNYSLVSKFSKNSKVDGPECYIYKTNNSNKYSSFLLNTKEIQTVGAYSLSCYLNINTSQLSPINTN